MRKVLLLSLLLASAAASPAMAQSFERPDRGERGDRAERQSQRAEQRSERTERADRAERSGRDDRAEPSDQRNPRAGFNDPVDGAHRGMNASANDGMSAAERAQRIEAMRQQWSDSNRDGDRSGPAPNGVRNPDSVRPMPSVDRRDPVRDQRMDEMRERYQQIRDARRNAPPPLISRTPRPNSQPPERVDGRNEGHSPRWSSHWRDDHRYDWKRHRRHNNWRFNFGFYSDPFGWGYQPYSIGWRMWPNYYGRNYWLNDPWQYRLPYAPAGTRWIRYFNDAILVDTWNGRVLDVINDFFW